MMSMQWWSYVNLFVGRDGNEYPIGRVLQCPFPYPHLEEILVPVPIPSWATTLVSFPIPYGYLSAHTRTHYPHFNYEKTIKTSLLK